MTSPMSWKSHYVCDLSLLNTFFRSSSWCWFVNMLLVIMPKMINVMKLAFISELHCYPVCPTCRVVLSAKFYQSAGTNYTWLNSYRYKSKSWLTLMTPSFLFLISEFIAESGNEKFWEFVDTVKELTVYKQGGMFVNQNDATVLPLFFWSNVTLLFVDISHRICALLLQLDP